MLPKSKSPFDPPKDEQGIPYDSEIVEVLSEEAGPPYRMRPSPDEGIRTLFHFHEWDSLRECLERFRKKFPGRNFESRKFLRTFSGVEEAISQ